MEQLAMEHRWGTRRQAGFPVHVLGHDHHSAGGLLEDVSISGALVRTPLQAPIMSTVTIILPKRLLPGEPLTGLQAYVVRQEPDGFGVEWWSVAPGLVQALSEARMPTARQRDILSR